MKNFLFLFLIPIMFLNCASISEEKTIKMEVIKMKVKSSAFKEGENIPIKYTCDGKDISPEISWEDVPDSVESLALICDDPDAPMKTFVHWVIYNIPPRVNKLEEGTRPIWGLPIGAIQGINDFGNTGYGGPCPPRGPAHHYHFKLYGLNTKLDAERGISKKELLKKMEGHIIAKGELVGIYKRK